MENQHPTPSRFRKAEKHESRLRLAIVGPSGAGKTFTALAIGKELGSRIAVIDTERGSAAKYADEWPGYSFDVLEMTEHSPMSYAKAIKEAEAEGYDVLVIDSLSHAWMGTGGALELVDQVARRSRAQNSFAAWGEVTPLHKHMLDTILGSKMHIVATLRAKTEWSQERDDRGKTVIRKVGLAPVQRDGIEYEFDLILEMDTHHTGVVTKGRCSALADAVIERPGKQVADALKKWLSGAPIPAAADPVVANIPKAEKAPQAEQFDVLGAIAGVRTQADLSKIVEQIQAMPEGKRAKLRRAYAAKRDEIRTMEPLRGKIADIFQAQPAEAVKAWVAEMSDHGIGIASAQDIDFLSLGELELAVHTFWRLAEESSKP